MLGEISIRVRIALGQCMALPCCPAGVATWRIRSIMKRMRTTWMALMGGILLVTLSVSAAFGAPPTAADGQNRGQTVAGFVHELVFGQDTPDEDPTEEEQEEEVSDEESDEEDSEEDESDELVTDEEQEESEEEGGEESDSHGACVSEIAHDKAGENDPEDAEYRNHGERVSEAARVTCWDTDDEEDADEDVVEDEEQEESEESDAHGACVAEAAHDKAGENDPEDAEYRNHGARVSEAALFLCWGLEVGDESDEEAAEVETDEVEATGDEVDDEVGPGKSGNAKANGQSSAPGQQNTRAGNGRGNGGNGGGHGRGGR